MIDGPRGCGRGEVTEVIALVDGEMRQGIDQSMLTDYPLVYMERNIENLRILKVDGELASVVPFIPRPVVLDDCRFTAGIISPTATAPHHRRQGYGARCLADCIARMTQIGCELSVLWTLPTTFPFYEQGDYQGVRSQGWTYPCGGADAAMFRNGGETVTRCVAADPRHIEAVRAMHERGLCGVRRSVAEYGVLLSLPKMETLLASRGAGPVAYLVVSRARHKPGLLEAGGEAAAVETLIHHALSELGEASLNGYADLTETVLGGVLEERLPGRRQPLTQGPMMVRLNQPRAFFQAIAPWLARQGAGRERAFSLGDAGETISFRFSGEGLTLGTERLELHFDLSRRELASVLFGAHPTRPVETPNALRDLFPFYFPIGMLDHS
jgi:GNAT superfamily N-acetyltransferase